MALWNKGLIGAGPLLLIGVAGMVLGPRLVRLAGRAGRPVARTALRTGADAYDRTREGLGGLIEESRAELGGLIEESRAEMKGRGRGKRPAARSSRPKRLGEELRAKP
jgi:hypothetical protein